MDPRVIQNALGRIQQVAQRFTQPVTAPGIGTNRPDFQKPIRIAQQVAQPIQRAVQQAQPIAQQAYRALPQPIRAQIPTSLPNAVYRQAAQLPGVSLANTVTRGQFQKQYEGLTKATIDPFIGAGASMLGKKNLNVPFVGSAPNLRIQQQQSSKGLQELGLSKDYADPAATGLLALSFTPFGGKGSPTKINKAAQYLSKTADKASIGKIMDWVIDVQTTGGKKNYGQLGQEVAAMAKDVYGPQVETLNNKQLANLMDATLKQIGKKSNNLSLGLVVEDLRGGAKQSQPGKIGFPQQPIGNRKQVVPTTSTSDLLQQGKQESGLVKYSQLQQQPQSQIADLPQSKLNTPSGGSIPPKGPNEIPKSGYFDDVISKVKGKVDQLYTESMDRFHPISKLGKQAGENLTMRRALTGHYGAGSTAQYHVEYELAPILKSVDTNSLRKAAIALRDAELQGRGIKGSNTGALDDLLSGKIGQSDPEMGKALKALYAYQDSIVKEYLVKTGIMSEASFKAMKSKNQFYVPFKRVMDQVDEYLGSTPQKRGAGSVGSQNVIKGIKGSDRDIVDPLESMIENTYKMVGLGKRQEVARTIVSLKDKLPEGMIKKIPYNGKVSPNSSISVFENGKAVKYQVPPEIADAAKGLSEDQLSTIVKILAAPTSVFRATATGVNPEFMIPNVTRDIQSAIVNVGINPLTFVSGLAHMIKRDDVYQQFLKSGGLTSRLSLDRPYLRKTVEGITNRVGISVKNPKDLYELMQSFGQYFEQPTRIAAFQKGLQQSTKKGFVGKESLADAAYAAQEGTVNFARRGSKTPSINAIYAFLNARAQGIDRLVRSVKDDPVGATTRIGVITVAPAIALYAHNRNFKSYNDPRIVSEFDKKDNFIIMLSDSPIEQLGGAQFIKIPKGDVGKMANPVETFLSYADGQGGDVGASLAHMLSAFSPINNAGDLVPTALRPAVENFANKNFFTGYDIVPDYQKNFPAKYQSNSSTAPIYKAIGDKINQSPAQIQNLAQGYLTGYARLGEMATQPLLPQYTSARNEQGAGINKTPVARRFLGGEKRTEEEQQASNESRIKGINFDLNDIKSGVNRGDVPAAEAEKKIQELKAEQQKLLGTEGQSDDEDIIRLKVKSTGTPVMKNGKLYYKASNGEGATINLNPPTTGKGIDAFSNQNWQYSKAREVFKANIPQSQKDAAYDKLGIDKNEVEYDYKANKSVDIKTQFLLSKNLSHDDLIEKLIDTRKPSISGQVYSTDGVIQNLVDSGKITAEEGKALKTIDFNKDGTKKSAKAKKPKKLKISSFKAPSFKKLVTKRIKAKKVKLSAIQLEGPKGAQNAQKVKLKLKSG